MWHTFHSCNVHFIEKSSIWCHFERSIFPVNEHLHCRVALSPRCRLRVRYTSEVCSPSCSICLIIFLVWCCRLKCERHGAPSSSFSLPSSSSASPPDWSPTERLSNFSVEPERGGRRAGARQAANTALLDRRQTHADGRFPDLLFIPARSPTDLQPELRVSFLSFFFFFCYFSPPPLFVEVSRLSRLSCGPLSRLHVGLIVFFFF